MAIGTLDRSGQVFTYADLEVSQPSSMTVSARAIFA